MFNYYKKLIKKILIKKILIDKIPIIEGNVLVLMKKIESLENRILDLENPFNFKVGEEVLYLNSTFCSTYKRYNIPAVIVSRDKIVEKERCNNSLVTTGISIVYNIILLETKEVFSCVKECYLKKIKK
jgi:hypothetical protein